MSSRAATADLAKPAAASGAEKVGAMPLPSKPTTIGMMRTNRAAPRSVRLVDVIHRGRDLVRHRMLHDFVTTSQAPEIVEAIARDREAYEQLANAVLAAAEAWNTMRAVADIDPRLVDAVDAYFGYVVAGELNANLAAVDDAMRSEATNATITDLWRDAIELMVTSPYIPPVDALRQYDRGVTPDVSQAEEEMQSWLAM